MGIKLNANLPEGHLRAIGQITANFALLELVISDFIWHLLQSDEMASRIVTSQMSFSRLVASFSSLFRIRLNDAESVEKLDKLVKKALQAEQKRNIITHSSWGSDVKLETITRFKATVRVHKGLESQTEKTSESDLKGVADFIAEVTAEIFDLLRSTYQKITKKPKN
jgi:hypothetical protein